MIELAIISAGAAKGLVLALADTFRSAHHAEPSGTFGAVGAMQDKLLAGEPCDVVILTALMIAALEERGHVVTGSMASLGRVRTGIAVRAGAPRPEIASGDSLKATLLAATSLYVPDTERSTAGKHVVAVLQRLGIERDVAPRLKSFPNGATAMRELAVASDAMPLGCTQVTEILYTPGVTLVGALPAAFELATDYAAAVCTTARHPDLAHRFVAMLSGPETMALRRDGGFER